MFIKIIILIVILIILTYIYNLYYPNKEINDIENFANHNVRHLNNRFNSAKLQKKLEDRKQEIAEIDESILFNNKDYNQNLSVDNKNNKYYYNDVINQSGINETAFNIVYSIDPIDYSNIETGIDKCNKNCNGICFENGYDGIATCYPTQPQTFDWGTLYKNPTFTYGYNAYGPENLPQ